MQFSADLDEGLQNSHELAKLSHLANRLLASLFPSNLSLRAISRRVADTSADWRELDPRSDGYRYPIDTKGQPATKENQIVNLRAMMTCMSSLLEDLDTIHFGLDIESNRTEEAYVALQEFMSE
jgi:hypothetical protein